MSAIASFVRLPIDALPDLRKAAVPIKPLLGTPKDPYWDFLRTKGQPASQYNWSGYVLVTLLSCLQEEYEIDLLASAYDELATFLCKERGVTQIILTHAQRQAYLDQLNPTNFSLDSLRDSYNAFEEGNEAGAGPPMMDGVRALHEALSNIDEKSVVLLVIG